MKWKDWLETRWGAYTCAICAGVLLWSILNHLPGIFHAIATFVGYFKIVIYGVILAYVMDFAVRFFSKYIFKKMKNRQLSRNLSIVITVALNLLLIGLLMVALIPQLITSITNLLRNWPIYVNSLSITIANIFNDSSSIQQQLSDWLTQGVNALNSYISKNSSNVIDRITTIGTGALDWAIAFILAVYFLVAKNWLLKSLRKLVRMLFPARSGEYHIPLSKINAIFSRYVICEIIDALIVGASNAVFMNIAGMPYVTLISVIVGVTNLAPTFGPIVGAVIGSFILLLVKPVYALIFLVFTIILQFCDGYILKPKMYGSALSVPSVWILVAIIVLGKMFGVAGILLAIPIAAIITYIVDDYMETKEAVHLE